MERLHLETEGYDALCCEGRYVKIQATLHTNEVNQ